MELLEWLALASCLAWGGLCYLSHRLAAAERDSAVGELAAMRASLAELQRQIDADGLLDGAACESAVREEGGGWCP